MSSIKKLSFIDRFLTIWIFLAMGLGTAISVIFPKLANWIKDYEFHGTNVPIAIGLVCMMVPPLAKVDYSKMFQAFGRKDLILYSLVLNWILGPILMFVLAYLFFPTNSEYRVGLILIGVARCIAMVLVWNDLAGGNREVAAGLVALNTIFQLVLYGAITYFFVAILPGIFGLDASFINVKYWDVFRSVLLYLGVPFALGWLIRSSSIYYRGKEWTERKLFPLISPVTLIFLLITIVFIFSLRGDAILSLPLDVALVALPLVIYFILMFFLSFGIGIFAKADYSRNVAISFTAAGNNFELAIAVAIGTFGIGSAQAFVGVVGPLIEIPVLILLVTVAKRLREFFYSGEEVV